MTFSAAPPGEQGGRHLGDGLPRGPLAHPDQHDAVARHQHVTALDGGHAPGQFGIAPPHGGSDEVRVELVDGLHQQRLVVAGRPEQRVECHAAVDPAGGVAGVERVGQRRHQVLGHPGLFAGQRPVARGHVAGQVAGGHAADQELGEPARFQRVEVGARLVDEPRPTSLGTISRSSSHFRASGFAIVSVSTLCSSTTSTRARASWRRSRSGRGGRSAPTAHRRRAGRRSWWESGVRAPDPVSRPAPCAACRLRSARRSHPRAYSCVDLLA